MFDEAMSIIDQANALGIGMEDWTFGGGTALMLQIDHRESHDVDLFIHDPQYLPYLNPTIQGYALNLAPSGYETDGIRMLKISYEELGEIDFICCLPVTQQPVTLMDVNQRKVRVELPTEIIAKKIMFRGARLQPRDMFDIAATSLFLGEEAMVEALLPFPSAVETALGTARAMKPEFAQSVMRKLLSKPPYTDLHLTAQDMTCRILSRVMSEGEVKRNDGLSP